MILKIIGALLIIFSCGSFGFKLASDYLRQENSLRQMMKVLDYMECELQCRLTPLPDLCKDVSVHCSGSLSRFFISLTKELDAQISPDVERCVSAALSSHKDLPDKTVQALELMGNSLGRFDLSGQIKGIDGVRNECRREIAELETCKQVRIRNYKTLALCAGAALVILFI